MRRSFSSGEHSGEFAVYYDIMNVAPKSQPNQTQSVEFRPDCPASPEEIRYLTESHAAVWNESSESLRDLGERYSPETKHQNEESCDRLLARAKETSGSGRESPELRSRIQREIADVLFSPGDRFARQFSADCGRSGEAFVLRAKRFDPSISEDDIHQALRNLWTFNSLQSYLGSPVVITSSAFAYSLLYPYTDNLLDGFGDDGQRKKEFLHWLNLTLDGERPVPPDRLSRAVARLLRMIENEFPRSQYPGVVRSLQAIHQAQKESLALCGPPHDGLDSTLLSITIAKGGTSVLADGFLVRGLLTGFEREALFGYGVLLQLIDDFRDIEEDRNSGISTPFSRAIRANYLDGITNRLVTFAGRVIDLLEGASDHTICRLISKSCRFLIQEGIARHPALFGPDYVHQMEEYVPVRLSYLGGLRGRLKSLRNDGSAQFASPSRPTP